MTAARLAPRSGGTGGTGRWQIRASRGSFATLTTEALLAEMGALAWYDADQATSTTIPDRLGLASDVTFGPGANAPTTLAHTGTDYMWFPGSAANYVSMPDAAALTIAGDFAAIAYVTPTNWTTTQSLAAKYGGTSDRTFLFRASGGSLQLFWSATGSTWRSETSAAIPHAGGWVAVAMDADNGASGADVTFYTSTDPPSTPAASVSWVQLGSTATSAPVATFFDSAGPLELANSVAGTSNPLIGTLRRAQVRSGGLTGTVVADFAASLSGRAGYTDTDGSAGGTWTVNRSASGHKSTLVQDRGVVAVATDDYATIPADARPAMTATDSGWVAVARRQWATPASNGNYVSNAVGTAAGLSLRANGTALTPAAVLSDGTTQVSAVAGAAPASGAFDVASARWTGSTLVARSAGVDGDVADVSTLGDRTPATALTIAARGGGGGSYQDFTIHHVITGQGAVTDAQLAQLEALLGALT